jgi:hypothetical protein
MDNRQHGLKHVEQSKTSKFQRFFNKVFGLSEPEQVKEEPKEKIISRVHKYVPPGGAFGKPRWIRSKRSFLREK